MEEEFDLNADSDIGTSVSKLRNNDNNEGFINLNNDPHNLRHTDTDIDYDKILENFNNAETNNSKAQFNYDNTRKNMETFTSTITDVKPKKAINMAQFAKNVEADLERFQNVRTDNYNEPLPVNYFKNSISTNNRPILEQHNQYSIEQMNNVKPTINVKPIEEVKKDKKIELNKQDDSFSKIINEYRDILMYVLIFILLNNKFIIEIIYNKIPFVNKIDNPYPNLIIRSVIFGLLIFAIKKFNL